tara:strand:+ start:385 stop:1503 length:1119 start_codon:yes stop_codon:yes gene_type:complete
MTRAAEIAKMGEVLTNSQIGGRRNIFINGAMNVAQRATSATGLGASTGYFTVDRWETSMTTSGRFTMSQVASGLNGFANAMKLDCTTADTSIASDEFLVVQQKLEGQDLQQLKKGTSDAEQVTISFYAKVVGSSTDVVFNLVDSDNSRLVSKLFTLTTNWARYYWNVPADTTGAFNDDNAKSLTLQIFLHGGSNYSSGTVQTTWGSNTTANKGAGVDSFFSSTDNEFFLTGVQMEVGSQATPFEHRSFGEELALCQRYYQKVVAGTGGAYKRFASGYNSSTTVNEIIVDLPTEMRSFPSLETTGTASEYAIYHGSTVTTCNAVPALVTDSDAGVGNSINIKTTVGSGLTAKNAAALIANNTVGAYLAFDSEL